MQTLVEIGLFSAPTGLLRRKNGTKKNMVLVKIRTHSLNNNNYINCVIK